MRFFHFYRSLSFFLQVWQYLFVYFACAFASNYGHSFLVYLQLSAMFSRSLTFSVPPRSFAFTLLSSLNSSIYPLCALLACCDVHKLFNGCTQFAFGACELSVRTTATAAAAAGEYSKSLTKRLSKTDPTIITIIRCFAF